MLVHAGGKVEEKKAGGNKALQPIASSVFYILRGSWPVMLNMALLSRCCILVTVQMLTQFCILVTVQRKFRENTHTVH